MGTTSRGPRALEHPLRRLELGGKLIAKHLATAPGRAAVRIREIRTVERRSEPLPLADAHSHARGARLDEPGSSRRGVPVRNRSPARRRREFRSRSRDELRRTPKTLERITLRLEEVLGQSGYVHGEGGGSTRLKIRRLIRRMELMLMTPRCGSACCGRSAGSCYPDKRVTKVTLAFRSRAAAGGRGFRQHRQLSTAPTEWRACSRRLSLDKLTVDYDASRLMKLDVEAVLLRHGLPIGV